MRTDFETRLQGVWDTVYAVAFARYALEGSKFAAQFATEHADAAIKPLRDAGNGRIGIPGAVTS